MLQRTVHVLTAGWSRPRVFSLMARASFSRLAASLYLFWSLTEKTGKHRLRSTAKIVFRWHVPNGSPAVPTVNVAVCCGLDILSFSIPNQPVPQTLIHVRKGQQLCETLAQFWTILFSVPVSLDKDADTQLNFKSWFVSGCVWFCLTTRRQDARRQAKGLTCHGVVRVTKTTWLNMFYL